MFGLGDLLMGGAQTSAVPEPQVSIADLLAGQAAPPPAMGGNVATAYATSPAPGAVAAAGAEAQAAGAQEPGILDQARNWAKTNPIQAQALMQGFAALASGRTHGNAIMQLGQAAGTAGQTMVEQTNANAERDRSVAAEQQRQQLAQQQEARLNSQSQSNIRLNEEQGQRAGIRLKDDLLTAEQARAKGKQGMEQSAMLFTPRMEEARLGLDKIRADIASTTDQKLLRKLQIEEKQHELGIRRQFGSAEAQAILDRRMAEAAGAQEGATQEVLKTDDMVQKRDAYGRLPQGEADRARLGLKADPALKAKTVEEISEILYEKSPELYQDVDAKTGAAKLNVQRLLADATGLKQGSNFDPNTDIKVWQAAASKVKIGERYQGPDGQFYRRSK